MPTLPVVRCFGFNNLLCDISIVQNENIALQSNGGAIYCKNSRPWIKENLIQDNRAVNGAAGFFTESEPAITGNNIVGNTMYEYGLGMIEGATYGALTFYICRDFLISGNRIADNIAFQGAGICVQTCFNGRIVNNLIVGNQAYQPYTSGGIGGGIYCQVAQTPPGDHLDDVLILNNTIVGNTASNLFIMGGGGGIAITLLEERLIIANNTVAYNSSGIWQAQSITLNPEFVRNVFYDNPKGPGTDYNYVYLEAGLTDISANPLFVNADHGDYHLSSGSPCIDAGEGTIAGLPTTDIDGNTRPKDGDYDGAARIDIGAYEFSQCVGDFEGEDGDVDGRDLAHWMIDPKGISLQAFAARFGRDDCQ
jgi:predicted outer membrane repeat protein